MPFGQANSLVKLLENHTFPMLVISLIKATAISTAIAPSEQPHTMLLVFIPLASIKVFHLFVFISHSSYSVLFIIFKLSLKN